MTRYNIRRISIWPAFKFGAVIGAVLAILPGILSGLLLRSVVGSLSNLSGSMGSLTPGSGGVTGFSQWLMRIDQLGTLTILWVTLGSVVGSGLAFGISTALGALIYNLVASISGGLVISAELLTKPAGDAQPAPAVVEPKEAMPVAQGALQVPQHQPPAASSTPAALPMQPPLVRPIQEAPVVQPSGPWLSLTANPAQRWPLRPDRTRLGGATDNDIVLPGLGAYHAEIRYEDGLYVLYNMAAGQTWVNGRPVAGRNMLKEGFQIRLGGQDLVFHAG